MIMSKISVRRTGRWWRHETLLGLVAVLFLAVTHALGTDVEAVERRLGKAVSEGELSLEQAAAMMEVLHELVEDDGDVMHRIGRWVHATGKKLKEAVKAGQLSEEEAWKKWHHFKEHDLAPKLKATVAAGAMRETTARRFWHAVEKAEADERIKAAVAKGKMTKQEARAKWKKDRNNDDRGKGIARHYRNMGVTDEALGGIKKALAEHGIAPEKMEGVLGGMLRMIHGMKSSGKDYDMDRRLREHFSDRVGLAEKQIELVEQLAQRIVHGMTETGESR